MVTIIARFKVQAGKEEEALEQLRKMADSVQAQEPGALAYLCHRSQDNPSEIVFFEMYADDAAFQAHAQTPHMGEMRASFSEFFDLSQVKIERLDQIAGFARG
jgi:quinol monooxygenase YgiN